MWLATATNFMGGFAVVVRGFDNVPCASKFGRLDLMLWVDDLYMNYDI